MFKQIIKFLCVSAIFLAGSVIVSCGVSTREVVDNEFHGECGAGTCCVPEASPESAVQEENVNNSSTSDEYNVVFVKPGDIPIIEICPPPYVAPVPGEEITEKEPEKPGESYDNLFPPLAEEDSEEGIVVVLTDIPGVEVSFNNRVVGESNIGVSGITPRIYILGLSKEGYKEESLWISVGENKKQTFFVEMEKLEE